MREGGDNCYILNIFAMSYINYACAYISCKIILNKIVNKYVTGICKKLNERDSVLKI